MGQIITYNLQEDFISRFVSHLQNQQTAGSPDYSRMAVVFGGKRPALFVKKELARRIKSAFVPPAFFTIDEFVDFVLFKKERFKRLPDLEAGYLLFQQAKADCPQILKGRETFAEFLPWAREILAFVENLDLEHIPNEALRRVEQNAAIGYDVPADINLLLESISLLRASFHQKMEEGKSYSRGFAYLRVSERVKDIPLEEFDQIFFANLFSLHQTESQLLRVLFDRGQATMIFQGHEDDWPILKENAKTFHHPIKPVELKASKDFHPSSPEAPGSPSGGRRNEVSGYAGFRPEQVGKTDEPGEAKGESTSAKSDEPGEAKGESIRLRSKSFDGGLRRMPCEASRESNEAKKGTLAKSDEPGEAKGESTLAKSGHTKVTQVLPVGLHLELFSGFDTHSQVGLVREIVKKLRAQGKDLNKTVIVVPQADHVIPLLSEVTALTDDFNISLGYPLKRSSFYTLLHFIFRAQISRKAERYYAKDYLKALRHPFVKNLRINASPTVTRILIHKIEEILTGAVQTPLGGQLFIGIKELSDLEELYERVVDLTDKMGIAVKKAAVRGILALVHEKLFLAWEPIANFRDFADALQGFLDLLIDKSIMAGYPLNLKMAQQLLVLVEEIRQVSFHAEPFSAQEMFKIFANRLERGVVSFLGSPVKGMQILGLLETRSLNFENVIVMDLNEKILPNLRVYDPLIPREVSVSLGLSRLEHDEEIQRYQLFRLLSAAQNAYLVFEESKEKEKSRFVEELLWERQKKTGRLDGLPIVKAGVEAKLTPKQTVIQKTPEVLEFLGNFRYSASSLNTYLRCPLQFYFRHVLGLEEKEDLLGEPENRQVGTFIHELLETTFRKFIGTKPVFNAQFRKYFEAAFADRFEETFERSMKSDAFLLKAVMQYRLKAFLDKEEEAEYTRSVEEVLTIEQRYEEVLPLTVGPVRLVYKVDRVDRLANGTIMLVDYKTGSEDPMPKGGGAFKVEQLTRESLRGTLRSFQMPLYFDFLSRHYPGEKLNAMFYNLRDLETKQFLELENADMVKDMNAEFRRALEFILGEILDPQVPFKADDRDQNLCDACPFYNACR